MDGDVAVKMNAKSSQKAKIAILRGVGGVSVESNSLQYGQIPEAQSERAAGRATDMKRILRKQTDAMKFRKAASMRRVRVRANADGK